MAKEKVYIVLSHVHSLKKDAKGKGIKDAWEVSEKVEFVNQLRNRHHSMSTAIGDYLNKTMLTGARAGMGDYSKFDEYIRKKYSKQMAELDAMYGNKQVAEESVEIEEPAFIDQFGNKREKTVFDV